jgi:hypothetical protein
VHEVAAPEVRPRPVVAERRQPGPDQLGVPGPRRLRVEAPRRRGVDDHVGPGDQLAQAGPVGGVVDVEHDRALRAVVLPEEERPLGTLDVLGERPDAPAGRAARGLHLHHVGAEAGQHQAHVLGRLVGQLDDADAREVRRRGIPSRHTGIP